MIAQRCQRPVNRMLKFSKDKNKKASAGESRSRSDSNPQAITAGRNAMLRLAIVAQLVVAIPTGLAFSYLILVREPALQQQQLGRLSAALASQQATNIHHMFARLRARIGSAAQSPGALSALASQSDQDIAGLEQDINHV